MRSVRFDDRHLDIYNDPSVHYDNGPVHQRQLGDEILGFAIHFPGSHTGVRIAEQIEGAVRKFDIESGKVARVTHNQAANVNLAGEILWEELAWENVSCSAHRLQLAIKGALEGHQRHLDRLLAKCRSLVGHFKHSALATSILDEKQRQLGIKQPLHVVQACATRWNSTFYMLHRLLQLKSPLVLMLADLSQKE